MKRLVLEELEKWNRLAKDMMSIAKFMQFANMLYHMGGNFHDICIYMDFVGLLISTIFTEILATKLLEYICHENINPRNCLSLPKHEVVNPQN